MKKKVLRERRAKVELTLDKNAGAVEIKAVEVKKKRASKKKEA